MVETMHTELSQSSSVARLRERIQGTLRINLGDISRERRISSLRELRRSFVEAKRNEYIKRLQESLVSYDEPSEGTPEQSETDMDIESDGSMLPESENNKGVEGTILRNIAGGKFRLVKDINKILTWPEFLIATEREIKEESIALKQSLMFIRPEGHRVLVVVNKFVATEYRKDGTKCRSFKVAFSKGPTMLDCVVNDYSSEGECDVTQLKYFVLDVMMYNGCLLAHSDSECRIFFLRSRLEEEAAEFERPGFSMVDYIECTPENMLDAYYRIDHIPYERDSVMFVDRRSPYVGGYNPNWLCWRDENTSKYLSNKSGPVPARVVYEASDNTLKTLEGVEICKAPKRIRQRENFVTTIMVKDMDLSNMEITDYIIPSHADSKRRKCSHPGAPADSLRKIVSKFILANVEGHDSNTAYHRLVDAVTAA